MSNHISDNDKRIIDAQSYIRKHFTQQNLHWMILQNRLVLHHRHFADRSKRTGITYIQYLNELRVQRACKLLTSSGMNSISSVAFNSGFNSLTNFNRVFRTIMKYSPKEYLKRYKETIME